LTIKDNPTENSPQGCWHSKELVYSCKLPLEHCWWKYSNHQFSAVKTFQGQSLEHGSKPPTVPIMSLAHNSDDMQRKWIK